MNAPTAIALNFVDYLAFANREATTYLDIEPRSAAFIADLEIRTGVPVKYIGIGPGVRDILSGSNPVSCAAIPTADCRHSYGVTSNE